MGRNRVSGMLERLERRCRGTGDESMRLAVQHFLERQCILIKLAERLGISRLAVVAVAPRRTLP